MNRYPSAAVSRLRASLSRLAAAIRGRSPALTGRPPALTDRPSALTGRPPAPTGPHAAAAGGPASSASPSPAPASTEGPGGEPSRQVIERFAAGVAHDLNNVLLVLQGYAEMAAEEPDSGPGIRALLEEMRSAAARASRLVQDLQLIGGRGAGNPRLLDAAEAVRRSLPALRSACPPGFAIRASLDEGLPLVRADEDLVARLLAALCTRAREAMPEGGEVLVRASAAPRPGGPWVSLAVTDAGAPLTDEMRARMFEPYLPGPGGTKGQGLGMPVVQAISRRLGGEILVGSRPGSTTVEVLLPPGAQAAAEGAAGDPADPAAAAAGPPGNGGSRAAAGAPAAPGRPTILVAEDDDGLRALAVKVLSREGYRVLAARDGQEAVELFEREAPSVHLVLLDDVMPRLGGRAALDRIQARAPALPVILCSGYNWNLDLPAAGAAGRCHTLAKPWQPRDLLRKVREGLEQAP